MKHSAAVPAFLTKLWTLVENTDTNELICWSQEGNSFLVLDEQRFSKEILPKFFKHNNMASFIRQLNMYGFRKVLHVDSNVVKQERDGPVEFQHPHFKHGQDELLENIKRKVPNTRPEDSRIRQEELTKILASVQHVHSKQENIDTKLSTLKRENEALWREISDLRQKHAHQQQLIKKLIQFIVTLVQNNRILNLKRKRPSLMNSSGKKSKCLHQIFDDTSSTNSLQGVTASDPTEEVIICDVSEGDVALTAEVTEESPTTMEPRDVEMVEVELDSNALCPPDPEGSTSTGGGGVSVVEDVRGAPSSALQLNKGPGLSLDDPLKMMDSILMENGAISQNINLLGKLELMDYLDSIDCSLEDFQALLQGKQFSCDLDSVEEGVYSQLSRGRTEEDNTDKQLIQYTSCPLLPFLDGCSPAELEVPPPSSSPPSGPSPYAELPSELLENPEESKQPGRSSLVRLEPLTEAEASQETLFHLCELSPGPEGGPSPHSSTHT